MAAMVKRFVVASRPLFWCQHESAFREPRERVSSVICSVAHEQAVVNFHDAREMQRGSFGFGPSKWSGDNLFFSLSLFYYLLLGMAKAVG